MHFHGPKALDNKPEIMRARSLVREAWATRKLTAHQQEQNPNYAPD